MDVNNAAHISPVKKNPPRKVSIPKVIHKTSHSFSYYIFHFSVFHQNNV